MDLVSNMYVHMVNDDRAFIKGRACGVYTCECSFILET